MERETNPANQDPQNENPQPNPGTGENVQGGGGNQNSENGGETATDYKAKYDDAISHSREWEKRAKANKEAADELQKLKDAQKTDAEKQAEYTKQLEAENAQYKAEKDRAKWAADIAETSGVPAKLLRGSTHEEIEAHAEELKPFFETENEAGGDKENSSDKSTANAFGKSPQNGPQSTRAKIDAAVKAGDYDLAANLKASMLGVQN